MRIRLVTDVPDQRVLGRVEDIVQRDGQFDDAEPGPEVAAGDADGVDQFGAQFARRTGEVGGVEAAEVGGRVDGIEQRGNGALVHAGHMRKGPR